MRLYFLYELKLETQESITKIITKLGKHITFFLNILTVDSMKIFLIVKLIVSLKTTAE